MLLSIIITWGRGFGNGIKPSYSLLKNLLGFTSQGSLIRWTHARRIGWWARCTLFRVFMLLYLFHLLKRSLGGIRLFLFRYFFVFFFFFSIVHFPCTLFLFIFIDCLLPKKKRFTDFQVQIYHAPDGQSYQSRHTKFV